MKRTHFSAPALLLALVFLFSAALPVARAEEEKTYTVSANLFCPGELNTQLPGVTAYLTNGSNPLGEDGYEAAPPVTPMTDNATLTVGADGALTVTVPILNPVFTLQSIAGCSNAEVVSAPRDDRTYTALDGSDSRAGRITSLTVQLSDASGSYVFADCREYPTLLSAEWTVPLTLSVDFTGVPISGGAGGTDTPDQHTPETNTDALSALISAAERSADGVKVSADGTDVAPGDVWTTAGERQTLQAEIAMARAARSALTQSDVDAAAARLGEAKSAFLTACRSGKQQTEVPEGGGVLAEGSYTVSCNVWFNKADTGLPLNPHITNPTFPPYNPVADNAVLTVDSEGGARVTVPVTIQDKIMVVCSLTGLTFEDVERGENGGITAFSVDLGRLSDAETVVTRSCTAEIDMGDLAMSISGLDKDHTWPAVFELNLSGVARADGGEMAEVPLKLMNAEEASDAMAGAGTALPEDPADPEEPQSGEPEEDEGEAGAPEEESSGIGGAAVAAAVVLAAAAAGLALYLKKRRS